MTHLRREIRSEELASKGHRRKKGGILVMQGQNWEAGTVRDAEDLFRDVDRWTSE